MRASLCGFRRLTTYRVAYPYQKKIFTIDYQHLRNDFNRGSVLRGIGSKSGNSKSTTDKLDRQQASPGRKALENSVDELLDTVFDGLKPVAYLSVSKAAKRATLESNKLGCTLDEEKVEVEKFGADVFGSKYDWGCIMDDPENNMAIPLLDLDLKGNAEKLLSNANLESAVRKKPLYAIVRGYGTGKTRLLEELRRHFLTEEDGVLCVAITFNNKTPLNATENGWRDDRGINPDLFYALVAIARMSSSFYGINHEDVTDDLNTMMNYFEALGHTSNDVPKELVRGFVRRMVKEMRVQGCDIRSFVLLTDETLTVGDSVAFVSLLCKSLLNESVSLDTKINAAVGVSSLETTSFGTTVGSGRVVLPLPLAEMLDKTRVVEDLWGLNRLSSNHDKLTLELIASMVNRVPRYVEIIREFTIRNATTTIDPAYVEAMFRTLQVGWTNRYPSSFYVVTCCLAKVVCNAILLSGRELAFDNDVSSVIKLSILTNQVTANSSTLQYIQPQMSMMTLYYAALYTREFNGSSRLPNGFLVECLIRSVESVIGYLKRRRPSSTTEATIGGAADILETVFIEWLVVRIAAASYLQHIHEDTYTTTAADLMGLSNTSSSKGGLRNLKTHYPDLAPLFDQTLDLLYLVTDNDTAIAYDMAYSSHSNEAEFLKELKAANGGRTPGVQGEESPGDDDQPGLVIIKSCAGESWDMCVKFFYPESTDPIYVFVNNKEAHREEVLVTALSGTVVVGGVEVDNGASDGLQAEEMSPPDHRRAAADDQYKYTRDLLARSGDKHFSSFVYIYANNTSLAVGYRSERAVHLGVTELASLLGPMYDLYRMPQSQVAV